MTLTQWFLIGGGLVWLVALAYAIRGFCARWETRRLLRRTLNRMDERDNHKPPVPRISR